MKADPKTTDFLLFVFFYFLTLLPCSRSKVPSTTGYPCEATAYPCRTYAFYRATAPNFLNLAAIGDLFAVSRLMIAGPSNISSPSANLHPNQPLLVPLTCSCNAVSSNTTAAAAASGHRRLSYAPVNYTIKEGDTPYLLALYSFLNLTTFQSAFLVNPTLVPLTLSVGDTLAFPIFCKCPNRTQSTGKRADFLISYVYQPSDSLSSVASLFGADARSIIDLNGDQIVPFTTIFVPVNRLPRLPQTVFSSSSPPPPAVVAAASAGTPKRKGVTVGFGVGLGICGILLFLIVGLWAYREGSMRKWREMVREEEAARSILRGHSVSRGAKVGKEEEGMDDLGLNVTECLDKYTVYKIEDLRDATGGFDERCLIQGSVYKGSINGEAYAIKKMKWNAYEELKILQKVNHGNLVKLEGFCIDPEDANCYLVYEYTENGSLHSQLHGTQARKLSWKTRLRIAIDVANGLQYIHEHTRPRVVHKDIKSGNILLDSSMRAKIANFGLAKSGCNAITMHIVGTPGYIAPEYLADGVVSTKIDVFAFGVVLLELVSGREAVNEGGRVLWAGAAGVLEGDDEEEKVNQLRDWMDGDLVEELGSIGSVMDAMTVAVSCLHKDPFKRPSMVDIVYALCKKGDDASFEIPKDEFSSTR